MIEYGSTFTAAATKGGPNFDTKNAGTWTHTLVVRGTGAVAATVVFEISDNGEDGWQTLCTLDISGTTEAVGGYTGLTAGGYLRHRCTAVTGTGAKARASSKGVH